MFFVKTSLLSIFCLFLFFISPVSSGASGQPDPQLLTDVLSLNVHEGLVDYRRLQAHQDQLDLYLKQMAEYSRDDFDRLVPEDQIALWINLYNASVLKKIIQHYPLTRKSLKGLAFPSDSIWQIPNVWKEKNIEAFGRDYSLDEIENSELRKKFKEPRIHAALVCASAGCPVLRNKAYEGRLLDNQLDDQMRRFLTREDSFKIDRKKRVLYLSSIFKWFGEDFKMPEQKDTSVVLSQKFSADEQAVVAFIMNYIPRDMNKDWDFTGYRIDYIKYDWSLNEE